MVDDLQNKNQELMQQIEICQEENIVLDKMHRQKVAEVGKLTQTVWELEEAVLAGGAAANAVRDYQSKVQEMNERSRILLKFADLVEKHNDDLAALETWNNGKPYEQGAQGEVPMFARLFCYYAGWADKIHGMMVLADRPYHVQTLHEPIGVAGQIIPWNFPLLMFAWKVGPALACGNTIVLKSAEQTPLTALYAAKLLHEAGFPPGGLNIVSGYGPTAGAALASHMDVDQGQLRLVKLYKNWLQKATLSQ